MRKIKTLFVIDNIAHIGGGSEGQLSKLINHLDRDEFEVHLTVLRHSSWVETNYFDCPKSVVGIGSLKYPQSWRKIWQFSSFIRDKKFDIVQTYFFDSNLVGAIAGRWGKAKRIISAQRSLGYNLSYSQLFALKRVDRWVDRYLVNCQAVKRSLTSKLGVFPDKIDVIYNGVDYQRFKGHAKSSKGGLKKRLGIQEGELVVGLTSNFRPVKNIDNFLYAASKVSAELPQAKFLIIGWGKPKEVKRIKQLASDLNIGHKLIWTEIIEDVVPYLGLMDLGVLSSLSEGLSNTILEYMACGLPVVATAVGGNPELVVEGEGGFLVSPNDHLALAEKILFLLNQPQLREKMGRMNQGIIQEKFGLIQMINNHQEYFRRLLEYEDN